VDWPGLDPGRRGERSVSDRSTALRTDTQVDYIETLVGRIATAYGLDGPVIEPRWGRDFPHLSRPALRPTQPTVQWIPGLSSGRSGRGVTLTPHPLLVQRSKIE